MQDNAHSLFNHKQKYNLRIFSSIQNDKGEIIHYSFYHSEVLATHGRIDLSDYG